MTLLSIHQYKKVELTHIEDNTVEGRRGPKDPNRRSDKITEK